MNQEGSSNHSSYLNQSTLQALQHSSAVSEQFENFVVPSIPALFSIRDLNVSGELEAPSQAPGCQKLPSKLSVFNQAFLDEFLAALIVSGKICSCR